jgi:hypothetical protein
MGRSASVSFILAIILLLFATALCSEEIRVLHTEGLTRGFMVLRTETGEQIADGEMSEVVRNGVVTARQTFRFKDGSLYDDETRFTQHGTFRLLSDHSIQKGPTFPTQMETWIDTANGQVTMNSSKDGKSQNSKEKMSLPNDLANGILFTIVKSMLSLPQATVSYVAFTPKPRIVKVTFAQEGKEPMYTDGASHDAIRFLMKIDIGGITGAVATITGKKPADTHIWVITGTAPTYAGSEGPLYGEGPVWKIELVSPRRQ